MTSNWIFENKNIEDIPDDTFGFVYIITNKINNKIYIGKKQFFNKTNKKLTKKEINELPTTRGRKKTKKLVISESNWKDYWGSCKELKEDIKKLGEENFTREIIQFCYSSKQLSYYEICHQIKFDVLKNDNCYNDNIAAKFFRADLV